MTFDERVRLHAARESSLDALEGLAFSVQPVRLSATRFLAPDCLGSLTEARHRLPGTRLVMIAKQIKTRFIRSYTQPGMSGSNCTDQPSGGSPAHKCTTLFIESPLKMRRPRDADALAADDFWRCLSGFDLNTASYTLAVETQVESECLA